MGRYPEAVGFLTRRILRKPDTDMSRALLAASYGQMGMIEEAHEGWRKLMRVNPNYSVEQRRKVLPYKGASTILAIYIGRRGTTTYKRKMRPMNPPQIIRTPNGEELVVLPRAEYEALVERADNDAEDAEDVAVYDARKAELAAGGVVLPPEVSAAILRGDSRLKAIRNWRDETQLHLSFMTGIAQGYLSDLEGGRRTGTPETIAKLAQALNVPAEWLL